MWNTEIKNRYLMIFLIFLTGFLTGFLTFVNLPKIYPSINTSNIDLGNGFINSNFNKYEDLDLNNFYEVYNIIKRNYYSNSEVSNEKLVDGAIKGMVEALGDRHSEYFTPKGKKAFSETLSGKFSGIGAYVSKVNEGIRIDSIMKGSPAKAFGILPGDIIIKADGVELKDLEKYDAISKVKGPSGSKVILTIYREGEKDLLEKTVVRSEINVPTVHSEVKDKIGYISVNIFAENTASEFEKELEKVKKANVEGIILDLRQNGGGYLTQAILLLSNFIDKNDILVKTRSKTILNGNEVYKSIDINKTDLPLVVLIDESSASASEITAGAIKDHKRGILVGVKSYGKGSVQRPFEIGDKRLVKITTSKWFTPNDYSIDGVGIEPDIEIKLSIDSLKEGIDNQKVKAIEILKTLVKEKDIEKVSGLYNDNK